MSTSSGQHHPFARILIVDDHAGFRTALVRMLRREYPHSDLVETRTIGEARLRLVAYPMDVAFIAMRLPDGSGLRLIEEIKAAHSSVRTVFLASEDAPEYRRAAAEHGARHFICKGCMAVDTIRAPVDAVLASKTRQAREHAGCSKATPASTVEADLGW